MYYNKPLVPTTEKMGKEGINNMETKHNVVKTAITRVIYTIIRNYVCIYYLDSE